MAKLPERYIYPAVFTYENGEEIAVVFPDLDVATSGENDADALASASELLGAVLYSMEEDGEGSTKRTIAYVTDMLKGPPTNGRAF